MATRGENKVRPGHASDVGAVQEVTERRQARTLSGGRCGWRTGGGERHLGRNFGRRAAIGGMQGREAEGSGLR